jgi:hypothetical protein
MSLDQDPEDERMRHQEQRHQHGRYEIGRTLEAGLKSCAIAPDRTRTVNRRRPRC